MNSDFLKKRKVLLTLLSVFLVLLHLLVEYFQGGIVTHYFLQSGSLPGISNWWGLISFPLTTWVVLTRIEKRKPSSSKRENLVILYRFISGVLFGVLVSYLFTIDSGFLDYLMLGLFVLSFFIPLYFGEYLIGYTLGGMYVFGANILIIGGSILILILFTLYSIPRFIYKLFRKKVN